MSITLLEFYLVQDQNNIKSMVLVLINLSFYWAKGGVGSFDFLSGYNTGHKHKDIHQETIKEKKIINITEIFFEIKVLFHTSFN